MINDNHLRNYILKRIIKKVHVDKTTLTLVEDKTELTDSLLHELIAECSRYGLGETAARSLITQIAGNVNCNPSKKTELKSISVDKIAVGEHIRLNFSVEAFGAMFLELLCIEHNSFLVLDTTVSGTSAMDVLSSRNVMLNMGYDLQFNVTRNGETYPKKNKYLQIGKLDSVDRYERSFIHSLFDMDEDFSYANMQEKSEKGGWKYLDTVDKENGRIVFKPDANSDKPRVSLFLIEPNENDRSTAMLHVNVGYIFKNMMSGNTDFVEKLNLCVKAKSGKSLNAKDFESICEIKTVEPSLLQLKDTNWELVTKPIIVIIKNE